MNILITGGNGFIGKSLIPCLLQEKHKLKIIDSKKFTTKYPNEVELFNCDFRDNKVSELLENIDVVIHLAAYLGVDACENHTLHTLKANGIEACKFFELCKEKGVKHIIYTSSSEVYGDVNLATEESPVSPKSDYGIAKLYSEKYLTSISTGSLSSHILRLFSVYGKGQRDEFVVSKFFKQASSKKQLRIYGDGSQVRAFCHISDVANAIKLCIRKSSIIDGTSILNIGNHKEPITIKTLALKILKLYNLDPAVYLQYIPLSETIRGEKREIYRRTPSTSKAEKQIDYAPLTTLDKGLKEFIN